MRASLPPSPVRYHWVCSLRCTSANLPGAIPNNIHQDIGQDGRRCTVVISIAAMVASCSDSTTGASDDSGTIGQRRRGSARPLVAALGPGRCQRVHGCLRKNGGHRSTGRPWHQQRRHPAARRIRLCPDADLDRACCWVPCPPRPPRRGGAHRLSATADRHYRKAHLRTVDDDRHLSVRALAGRSPVFRRGIPTSSDTSRFWRSMTSRSRPATMQSHLRSASAIVFKPAPSHPD